MPPITPDNAREMQLLGAAAKRRKREEAEKLALEHMVAHFSRALEKHTDLLNAESEQVALAAVKEIYNRLLGRAAQALEVSAPGGPVQIIVESAFVDDSDITVSSDSEAEAASPSLEGPAGDAAPGIGSESGADPLSLLGAGGNGRVSQEHREHLSSNPPSPEAVHAYSH